MTAGPASPGPGESPAAASIDAPPTGPGLRLLDALAGLLSAGVLLVGVILLLAALIAPSAVAAAGLGVADGPGWNRVIAHLVVGGAGELVVMLRRRWPPAVRALADALVAIAALVVIAMAWLA